MTKHYQFSTNRHALTRHQFQRVVCPSVILTRLNYCITTQPHQATQALPYINMSYTNSAELAQYAARISKWESIEQDLRKETAAVVRDQQWTDDQINRWEEYSQFLDASAAQAQRKPDADNTYGCCGSIMRMVHKVFPY